MPGGVLGDQVEFGPVQRGGYDCCMLGEGVTRLVVNVILVCGGGKAEQRVDARRRPAPAVEADPLGQFLRAGRADLISSRDDMPVKVG